MKTSDLKANCTIDRNACKEQFTSYYSELKSTYDDCFQEETVIKSKRNFHDKPWISLALAKSSKVKNKLHRRSIRKRGKSGYEKAKYEFNLYRAKLRDLIRTARSNYYHTRFKNCKGDLKKSWKIHY